MVSGIVHVSSGVSTVADVTFPREVPVAVIWSGLPSCRTVTPRIVGNSVDPEPHGSLSARESPGTSNRSARSHAARLRGTPRPSGPGATPGWQALEPETRFDTT